jgi:hypothetical protein
VFIDETGLNTTMARQRGRSLIGQRCLGVIPHGHWQSSTFIAALRQESVEAPFLIEGPVDAEVFTVYLERVLCPQLREGDTLILDNLSTHKIHYVVAGGGAHTIIFVHCWAGNLGFWREQIPALAGRARLIFVDLPGPAGATSRALPKPWTISPGPCWPS